MNCENKYIPYTEANYFDMPYSNCYRPKPFPPPYPPPCKPNYNNSCGIDMCSFLYGIIIGKKLR